jgi:hypothetical protein
MTPADLRRLHKYMLEIEKVSAISDGMRAIVESEWPELAHKLPPRWGNASVKNASGSLKPPAPRLQKRIILLGHAVGYLKAVAGPLRPPTRPFWSYGGIAKPARIRFFLSVEKRSGNRYREAKLSRHRPISAGPPMSSRNSVTEPTSIQFSSLLKYLIEFSAITITYLAVAKFSLALASVHPSATPIWPPTGFALAVVLLLGYRIWPAIFLAAFIANATTAGSTYTSFAIATGNTLPTLSIGGLVVSEHSIPPPA